MQAALFSSFVSPAQRFKGINRHFFKNRLDETMFSNFCYDLPEATPADRIKADRVGYPPDIRRTPAGCPPDTRRISAGYLRQVVTKIRKHSFVEAVFRRVSICAFKT